jgi:hypothetical protein
MTISYDLGGVALTEGKNFKGTSKGSGVFSGKVE